METLFQGTILAAGREQGKPGASAPLNIFRHTSDGLVEEDRSFPKYKVASGKFEFQSVKKCPEFISQLKFEGEISCHLEMCGLQVC